VLLKQGCNAGHEMQEKYAYLPCVTCFIPFHWDQPCTRTISVNWYGAVCASFASSVRVHASCRAQHMHPSA
jgi:hypothetical protein